MADVNEIRALKASIRGAVDTAEALDAVQAKVSALDDHAEIDAELIEDLGRITLAHAVASNALRGLIESMRARRGMATASTPAGGSE